MSPARVEHRSGPALFVAFPAMTRMPGENSERLFFDGRLRTWSPFARKVMSNFHQNPRKHPKAPQGTPKAPLCWIWDAHGAAMGSPLGPMQLHGEPIGSPWGPLGAHGVPLGGGKNFSGTGSNHAKTIFTNSRSTALGRTLLVHIYITYIYIIYIYIQVWYIRCDSCMVHQV